MAVCERCSHDNAAGRESCARCGWYLRWELTGPGAPSDDGRGAIKLAVPAGPIAVSLGVPGMSRGPEDPLELSLAAGAELTLVARIRTSVREAEVSVEGLPTDWWSVDPSGGVLPAAESEVEVRLHPPHSAELRRWKFWVEVTPQDGAPGGRSPMAALTLDAPQSCVATLDRDRRAGRGAIEFTVRLHNYGTTPATVGLRARDDAGRCRCRCEVEPIALEGGQGAEVPVTIRPPRRIAFGRARDHRIRISATTAHGDRLADLVATYRQRPAVSRWLIVAVAGVSALVLAVSSSRTPEATVPRLTGLSDVVDAKQRLRDAGLRLEPRIERTVDRGVRPGTIVAQSPEAGTHADDGVSVSVVVAAPAPTSRPAPGK